MICKKTQEQFTCSFLLALTIHFILPPTTKTPYHFIDLFAGIGGFHLAFHALGAECEFASEINNFARKTYEANFQAICPGLFASGNFVGDISKVDAAGIPDFDILCAGFPCQAFSSAGLQKGFADPRGQLFFEIVRILKAKQPKAFILENVRNLLTHDKGATFSTIVDCLQGLGYHIHYKVIKACDFGLPQYRPRLFIIGFKENIPFTFPASVPLLQTISDIFKGECNRKIGYTILAQGRGGNIHRSRNWDGYIVDGVVRRLSVPEAKKMMGFPDTFIFPVSNTQAMKQLGNAVAVPAVRAVARQIILALDSYTNSLSK